MKKNFLSFFTTLMMLLIFCVSVSFAADDAIPTGMKGITSLGVETEKLSEAEYLVLTKLVNWNTFKSYDVGGSNNVHGFKCPNNSDWGFSGSNWSPSNKSVLLAAINASGFGDENAWSSDVDSYNNGYVVWKKYNMQASQNKSYNNVAVLFRLPRYDVTVNVNDDSFGSVTASPNPAIENETVTLTATPNAGYRLASFESTDVEISNNTFKMIAKAITITATFEIDHDHNFTFSNSGDDTIVATCTEGCSDGYDDTPLVLTLKAPETLAFDGENKISTVISSDSGDKFAGKDIPTISYYYMDEGIYKPMDEEPVNVGSYKATIELDDVDANAVVFFEITPIEMTTDMFECNPYIGTYDSNQHTIEVSSLSGGVITYSEDNIEYTSEPILYTDAGTYTVYFKISGVPNYIDYCGDEIVQILPAAISPEVTIENWTYGEQASIPQIVGNSGDGIVTYSYKLKTADDNAYSGDIPKNVGEYTLKVDISAIGNYQSGMATKDFVITRKSATVTPTDISMTVGSTQEPNIKLKFTDLIEEDISEITENEETKFYPSYKFMTTGDEPHEISGDEVLKNVGEYTIIIENVSDLEKYTNYIFTVNTGKFTVKKRPSGGGSTSRECELKFDTNGGDELKNISVKKGQKIGTIENPQKVGYIFDGWYKDKECTKPYDVNEEVTSSTTLYAGWKVDPIRQITLKIGQKEAMVLGKQKTNDVAPIIRNDRTMLPSRFVAEALGAKVEWNGEERKVLITKENVEIIIYIDSEVAYVNGEKVILDSPAFIENDRTYTPIRFIAERLNAEVEWIEETKEVIITKNI